MRDLSSGMVTGLAGPVYRPVFIAYLDILGDPIALWTGVGNLMPSATPDSILNGKTFNPLEAFASLSDITENDGIGGPVSIVLKANALDTAALRQIVRDKRAWRGRPAYAWMGLYNETFNEVVQYPVRTKTGVMTKVSVRRSSSDVSIEIVIDEDFGNSKSAPFHISDHREIYPADKFSAYMIKLANKPGGLEKTDVVVQNASSAPADENDQRNYY